MSKPFSWYPRYPLDYALDTIGLSLMEHGAYVLLLDHYYAAGKLPADMDTLHRICRAKNRHERGAVKFVVGTFFVTSGDGQSIHHQRVEVELAKRKTISESRSTASKCRSFDKQVVSNSSSNADTAQHSTATKDQKQGQSPKEELVWEDGLRFLMDGGTPEPQARSALGRMVKQYGVVILADAICDAAVQNPTGNRVAYLQAVLKGTKRDAGSSSDIPYGIL